MGFNMYGGIHLCLRWIDDCGDDMITTCITLTEKDMEFVRQRCINLSKFVRAAIERERNGMLSENVSKLLWKDNDTNGGAK